MAKSRAERESHGLRLRFVTVRAAVSKTWIRFTLDSVNTNITTSSTYSRLAVRLRSVYLVFENRKLSESHHPRRAETPRPRICSQFDVPSSAPAQFTPVHQSAIVPSVSTSRFTYLSRLAFQTRSSSSRIRHVSLSAESFLHRELAIENWLSRATVKLKAFVAVARIRMK